ncbi:MAG: hypothetical protein HQ522_15320 [Bacteroidetes bacterium]|nr:hypothetical protein [Bacteroidota bacterium]
MEDEFDEKIEHEETGELDSVKEPTKDKQEETIEEEKEVYESEKAED